MGTLAPWTQCMLPLKRIHVYTYRQIIAANIPTSMLLEDKGKLEEPTM